MSQPASTGARTRARELLLQALYQRQLAGHDCGELLGQFHEQAAYRRVDQAFFDESLAGICDTRDELEKTIGTLIDRPFEQLDPVEVAILLIGCYELAERADVPYRVVINEGVNLARRFGASDSHKYINACLDAAARRLRKIETHGRSR